MIYAIDPGDARTAVVVYDGSRVVVHSLLANDQVFDFLACASHSDTIAIEMIASYGMPVGKEIFETCVFIGQIMQAMADRRVKRIYRRSVKMHLCNSAKAKDANVRQALLDKFGGPSAIGKKATPGPLYGISGDKWAALAVAVTAEECPDQLF